MKLVFSGSSPCLAVPGTDDLFLNLHSNSLSRLSVNNSLML